MTRPAITKAELEKQVALWDAIATQISEGGLDHDWRETSYVAARHFADALTELAGRAPA